MTRPNPSSGSNSCSSWKTLISFFVIQWSFRDVFSEITVNEYIPQFNETRRVNHYYDRPAQGIWSKPIPDDGVEGWLVHARPHDACGTVDSPPEPPQFKRSSILLARRFNCTFADKALNAQNAGYSAIIIHNVGSDDAMPMAGSHGFRVNIPVVSMGEYQASDLLTRYSYQQDPLYTIIITDSIDISWLEKYLWPFFGIVTGCICCMGIYVLVKWGIERRRMRIIASRRRLSTKQLNKIPTKKFKKGDAYEVCAICLEDYEENDKLRILPCNHAYHTKCVDPWLTKSRKFCPVCKRKILTKKEQERIKRKQQAKEESQRRAEVAAREEEEEQEEEQRAEEEEDDRTESGAESSEEETDPTEPDEAQPLIPGEDPPLTVVDRLRRFFRRRHTIEVEVPDSVTQPPMRDNHSRSSYGSLNNVDPINSQIEAAENHLQQHMQETERRHPMDLSHSRRHFQNHSDELVRQVPTTVAVYATVHVDHHQPPTDSEDGGRRPDEIV